MRAGGQRAATPSERDEERGQSDVEMEMDVQDGEVEETPKGRVRVREGDGLETPRAGPSTSGRLVADTRPSLKRRREDEEEPETEDEADGMGSGVGTGTGAGAGAGGDDELESLDEVPPSEDVSAAQTSPTNEFIIRRKRARH